jgi:hypothetical protein
LLPCCNSNYFWYSWDIKKPRRSEVLSAYHPRLWVDLRWNARAIFKCLFHAVPVGTRVQFINQPVKATLEPDGRRYLEVHEPLSRTFEELNSAAPSTLTISPAVSRFIAKADTDSHVVKQAFEDRSGIPTQINP